MRRLATVPFAIKRSSPAEEPSMPPLLLRACLGRVQEALLRGVRLRTAMEREATVGLSHLADELDSVAEQIRRALRAPVKSR